MNKETTIGGTNPCLMTLEAWRSRHGMGLRAYFLLLCELPGADTCPALCTEDCMVSDQFPWCAHGCPSLLVALELD